MTAMYNMYKLQFQTQFHCYTYDSIWNNLQKQQYVHSNNNLLCFLINNDNIVCTCMHGRVFMCYLLIVK